MALLSVVIRGKDELSSVLATAGSKVQGFATDSATKLNEIGGKLQGFGAKLTLGVTTPLVALGMKAVSAASDLSETTSKVEVMFGKQAAAIGAWGDTAAKSMGQSKTAAMAAAADFSILGKAAGLSGVDLADFSTEFVELASDLASFSNTSPEEAIVAIGAALRGESEPIRKYGVLLNQASIEAKAVQMGLIDVGGELTQQAKMLATTALVYEQTSDAQGDFARTSDGLANQQRILKAKLGDVAAELGTKLLPIALRVVEGVSALIDRFSNLSPGLQKTILILGGVAAAAGPVITVIGTIAKAVGFLLPLIGGGAGFTAILGGLGTALSVLTGPIGLVIAAVGLLTAAWIKDWGGIRTKTKEALSDIGAWLGDTARKLGDWWNDLNGRFAGWVERARNIGGDIIRGIVDGIRQTIGNVWNTINGFFDNIFSRLKNVLGIRSPSRRAAQEIGLPFAQGIALGIESGLPVAMRSVTTNNNFRIELAGSGSAGSDVLSSVQLLSALYG